MVKNVILLKLLPDTYMLKTLYSKEENEDVLAYCLREAPESWYSNTPTDPIFESEKDFAKKIDGITSPRLSYSKRNAGQVIPYGYSRYRDGLRKRYSNHDLRLDWYSHNTEVGPLKEFDSKINDSKSMLVLEEGWDGNIGLPIDQVLFNISCKCISDYIEAIYEDSDIIIASPEINPVPNGSIDFEWHLDRARMLINFRFSEGTIHAYFYGDLLQNKIPIKGNVPTDAVYDHLMKWMQYLRK